MMDEKQINDFEKVMKLKTAEFIRYIKSCSDEELRNILGLTPGTVTPFGILNDKECKTLFFLDEDFLASPAIIGIHPNDNTSTVWLKVEDLLHIIEKHGNKVRIIST